MQLPPEVTRYAESLNDLKFNSKPIINSLTQIAQENLKHYKEIVYVIEERIRQVRFFVYSRMQAILVLLTTFFLLLRHLQMKSYLVSIC